MSEEIIISCKNICKDYSLYRSEMQKLKSILMPSKKAETFSALKDINIDIKKGENIGLIGLNGSGKSTLSSIIAGITYPTSGEIKVKGEVNMLSATSGLQSYLTGMQNIEYKCLLLGFTRKQIEEIRSEIIEFADIGVYIDQPIRTYSSGMLSRLGFAISINLNPDILIVDEALAVGDTSFTDKCMTRMDEYKQSGKTIIFVSHATQQMVGFCDRVAWIHRGKLVDVCETEKVVSVYNKFAKEYRVMLPHQRDAIQPTMDMYEA